MLTLWTRIRRLATSVMLLAALAFAFHTGAVAADFGLTDCVAHASSLDHVHADASAREHKTGAGGDRVSAERSHCKVPCCGSACTVAVLASVYSISPVRSSCMTALILPAHALSHTEPHGIERPPRSLMQG